VLSIIVNIEDLCALREDLVYNVTNQRSCFKTLCHESQAYTNVKSAVRRIKNMFGYVLPKKKSGQELSFIVRILAIAIHIKPAF
jgi:hypothetical protein